MRCEHHPHHSGNRFYVPDEKHLEYIDTVLHRALNGIPTEKGGNLLPRITQDDVGLIREFVNEIQANNHITLKWAYKYTYVLVHWREYIGEFRVNTLAALHSGIATIQNAKTESGDRRYSRHTLADYIGFIKRFYLWMVENNYTSIDEKKLRKIRPPKVTLMTKTAEELLSEEDVRRMIEACTNPRDRALISMLYEGGFRIGQIASLRWRQLKFGDWNVAVNVDNKTLKPRYIPLVMSRSYLATWRNNYPLPISDDGFVFLTFNKKEPLQYRGFVVQLDKIVKRAGITKHVSPHLFRHSRITHLVQKGFNHSKISLMMWGSIDGDMLKTYAHLSNNDIDEEVAQFAGISIPNSKKESDTLIAQQCPHCYSINEPTVKFCGYCGKGLKAESVDKLIEAEAQAKLLPEYQELVREFEGKLAQIQQKVAIPG